MTAHVCPGVTERDLALLRSVAAWDVDRDGPLPESALDAARVRRMSVERYLERRWSPRIGWVVRLTPRGLDLVREMAEP